MAHKKKGKINPDNNCVIVIIPDTSKDMANCNAKSNDDVNKARIALAAAIVSAISTNSDDGLDGIMLEK